VTKEERARQIDAEEFRRESERALARALAYSKQKRAEEAARVNGIKINEISQTEIRTILPRAGRQPKLHEYKGESLTLSAWSLRLGIPLKKLQQRVRRLGIAGAITLDQKPKRTRSPKPKAIKTPKAKAIKAPKPKRPPKPKAEKIAPKRKLYTHDGVTLNVMEWAKRLGICRSALHKRARELGSMEAAIAKVVIRGRVSSPHEHNGLSLTFQEWADRLGVKYHSFTSRVHRKGLAAAIEQGISRTPGVGQNLRPSIGTDAGSTAQDSPKITFSEKATTE
jgi:hypothetical protein